MAPLSRRQFLGTAGVSGLMLPFGAGCASRDGGQTVRSAAAVPVPGRFTLPFKRPAVIAPTSSSGDTDYFDVRAYATEVEILPGVRTGIFGYNGTFPGPTFRVRRGRTAVVRTRNDLPVPITTHLHGGHTPAASDGYPADLVLPTAGWTRAGGAGREGVLAQGHRDYTFPNAQRAATLWYHDHRMDFTGPQIWRGLFGMYLVHDDEEDALPLPRGDRDVPVMIADRAFRADGSLYYPSLDPDLKSPPGVSGTAQRGMTGDVILVNGVPWPRLTVQGARYRLRLLNASNARPYQVRLHPEPDGGAVFTQIGSDGGLLAKPQELNSIDIGPGERYDVVVDFARYKPGTEVTLRNGLGETGTTDELMRFVVGDRITDTTAVPGTLSSAAALDPAAAVRTRAFRLDNTTANGMRMYRINGEAFSTDRIWADPKRNETEIWEFTAPAVHPVHIHHSPFLIHRRGGSGSLAPQDAGWKDTALLRPREKLSVLVRFSDYPGKFVFHCHNLEHEDMAMMANFQVR